MNIINYVSVPNRDSNQHQRPIDDACCIGGLLFTGISVVVVMVPSLVPSCMHAGNANNKRERKRSKNLALLPGGGRLIWGKLRGLNVRVSNFHPILLEVRTCLGLKRAAERQKD